MAWRKYTIYVEIGTEYYSKSRKTVICRAVVERRLLFEETCYDEIYYDLDNPQVIRGNWVLSVL